MYRIFINGPITPRGEGNHAIEFMTHLRRGIKAATELLNLGYAVYCPMLDFAYWLVDSEVEAVPAEKIYQSDMAMLEAMDGVLALHNATLSINVMKERVEADRLRIPVFFTIAALDQHFKAKKRKKHGKT